MAIAAASVWEFRTAGAANNAGGGFFVTGASGTDFSQQDAVQFALTGVTSSGAGNVILTASAAASMVGNGIRTVSGTNFTNNSWFEITAVSVGVSITCSTNQAGASISTGVGSAGVMNIGGAIGLNSTLDDDVMETMVAGNIVHVKAGTYTLGEAITIATAAGTATNNIHIRGYNTTRGDNPTGSNRPIWSCGANSVTLGTAYMVSNMIFTGTAATLLTSGTDAMIVNCKITSTSTTAGRTGISMGTSAKMINSEAVSQSGIAVVTGSSSVSLIGIYMHDSDIGVSSGGNSIVINNCIFESIRTAGFTTSATNARVTLINNTFYGSEAKVGIGIRTTGVTGSNILFLNNIFYGLVTGVEIATVQQDSIIGDYNNFFNNTTDRVLVATGANAVALNPNFVGATQITGATATTSGSVLTQSGGDFSTVTDNVDYLRVTSGTGVTTGIYLITAHTGTTLTVNNALGTSSAGDVVYTVTTGHNLAVGTNMKDLGMPRAFNSNTPETTSYLDLGAAQRQATGGGGSFTFAG